MSKVAVIMGSTSDLPIMQDAIDILKELGVDVDVDIVSAHRTPYCRSRWRSTFARHGGIAISSARYRSSC